MIIGKITIRFLKNMNQGEKQELERLNDNPILLSAIRKVFDSFIREDPFDGFDYEGTNEQLGASLRAYRMALGIIEQGFKELVKFKRVEELKKKVNDAI
jgi:hypothetical protein